MIKEYICLPQSLAAAQTLQSLDLRSSRTAPRLLVTNKPSNTSTYKQTNRNTLKQYTNHGKTEVKTLKTSYTHYNNRNGTKNA